MKYDCTSYLLAYKDVPECSERLVFNLETLRDNPEESIRHSKHGESLKSIIYLLIRTNFMASLIHV
jgi:hypothetical protein